MADYLGISMNLKNFACSQYAGWNFDAMGMFNGQPIGGNGEGIFKLDTDNNFGAATGIVSFFESHLTDFGIANIKRPRRLIMSGEFDGEMKLTTRCRDEDSDSIIEKAYTVAPRSSRQKSVGIDLDGDAQARYWSFRIDNVAGEEPEIGRADFSVDSIEIIMVVLGKKVR